MPLYKKIIYEAMAIDQLSLRLAPFFPQNASFNAFSFSVFTRSYHAIC